MEMTERIELGCAGHLIVARSCQWRRHTQVGLYRISTLGDYYMGEERQTLGATPESYFETMVFKTTGKQEKGNEGCGCQEVPEYCEIDMDRYATAGDAQAGHETFVEKYILIAEEPNANPQP